MKTKQELLILNGKEYLFDIEQAKQLGLLKEKDSRVRSWKEFTTKYDKAYVINETSAFPQEANIFCTASQLTVHEAKAIEAFSKLLKLRRDWIGEWEPDLKKYEERFLIYRKNDHIIIFSAICAMSALSFPTEQMAKEFLETFRDLIEEAKILI